ncbi:hypothetical protein Dacet_1651 [Denitrovibrio acetiphilus DSM 12809]|uniref:Uncharacterized protein n=1 Tax=Denitrovibrio acetiphilus (strain DSM 12809 / NBRC 114555 / N2460) TaxID=522772 RepID=D4H8R7_DENA2|nr:hypothetical protein [Denitrovibrio acetiphilus]ADD68416.1 hypothetical protein Dacet_1651 [Denitrovibrio acetiphilus DSM 12809]
MEAIRQAGINPLWLVIIAVGLVSIVGQHLYLRREKKKKDTDEC